MINVNVLGEGGPIHYVGVDPFVLFLHVEYESNRMVCPSTHKCRDMKRQHALRCQLAAQLKSTCSNNLPQSQLVYPLRRYGFYKVE
jgi:hypothetical protein